MPLLGCFCNLCRARLVSLYVNSTSSRADKLHNYERGGAESFQRTSAELVCILKFSREAITSPFLTTQSNHAYGLLVYDTGNSTVVTYSFWNEIGHTQLQEKYSSSICWRARVEMAARTVATASLEARLDDVAVLGQESLGSSRDGSSMKSFRKREKEHMTEVEEKHLRGLPRKGIFELFFLYHPPFFYENREACGEEVHAGHVSKWTTFLIVETLLAALAIQPLVANVTLVGWQLDVYGLLWMLTLLGSFLGLVVNAALLGHLLHCPHKLAWIWLCKVGYVSEFPRLFMWVSSVMSLLAIGYTTWSLYGAKVGVPCVVVELFGLCFTKWLMRRLKQSLEETYSVV